MQRTTANGYTFIFDDIDLFLVDSKEWHGITDKGLSYIRSCDESIGLHRLIMGLPDCHVDHKDHNGLNNRRSNLRLANNQQNQANSRLSKKNTTGYRGVRYAPRKGYLGINKSKGRKAWQAQIKINYKSKYLGSFSTKEEAALAYDAAALSAFGEFASLNFPRK